MTLLGWVLTAAVTVVCLVALWAAARDVGA